jgi:hypothetical protein
VSFDGLTTGLALALAPSVLSGSVSCGETQFVVHQLSDRAQEALTIANTAKEIIGFRNVLRDGTWRLCEPVRVAANGRVHRRYVAMWLQALHLHAPILDVFR